MLLPDRKSGVQRNWRSGCGMKPDLYGSARVSLMLCKGLSTFHSQVSRGSLCQSSGSTVFLRNAAFDWSIGSWEPPGPPYEKRKRHRFLSLHPLVSFLPFFLNPLIPFFFFSSHIYPFFKLQLLILSLSRVCSVIQRPYELASHVLLIYWSCPRFYHLGQSYRHSSW